MQSPTSMSFSKFFLAIIGLMLMVSALTITVYILGQENGIRLANAGEIGQSPKVESLSEEAVMERTPTLPKAATATPKSKPAEKWSLTEQQAIFYLQEFSATLGFEEPLILTDVKFTPSEMQLIGQIDYSGYVGEMVVTGCLTVDERRLHFRVDHLIVNDQYLPNMLFPTVETYMDHFLNQLVAGYDVIDIELEEGFLSADLLAW